MDILAVTLCRPAHAGIVASRACRPRSHAQRRRSNCHTARANYKELPSTGTQTPLGCHLVQQPTAAAKEVARGVHAGCCAMYWQEIRHKPTVTNASLAWVTTSESKRAI